MECQPLRLVIILPVLQQLLFQAHLKSSIANYRFISFECWHSHDGIQFFSGNWPPPSPRSVTCMANVSLYFIRHQKGGRSNLLKTYRSKFKELLAYHATIVIEALHFNGGGWLPYDKMFREHVAKHPDTDVGVEGHRRDFLDKLREEKEVIQKVKLIVNEGNSDIGIHVRNTKRTFQLLRLLGAMESRKDVFLSMLPASQTTFVHNLYKVTTVLCTIIHQNTSDANVFCFSTVTTPAVPRSKSNEMLAGRLMHNTTQRPDHVEIEKEYITNILLYMDMDSTIWKETDIAS